MVVDANKLIAAFLKNGLIRRIIVLSGIKLYTIEQVLKEVNEHKDELLVKAGIDERVYNLITGGHTIAPYRCGRGAVGNGCCR